MDNVTHAIAGLLLGEAAAALVAGGAAAPATRFRRVALAVGLLTAELPDVDLVYARPSLGMGNLGYLLHHRGHTHTLLFAIVSAIVVWLLVRAWRGRGGGARDPREDRALLLLALAGTLSHVALDWTNNYGVHPFWPLSNTWHYGDAMFIVEPWLWVAALPALILLAHGIVARVLHATVLVAIIVAAFRVGMVDSGVGPALAIGAVAWGLATWLAKERRHRLLLALVGWGAVEAVFFAASSLARRAVIAAVPASTFLDASLTPRVGNPLCFRALVMERDASTWRVTEAAVAPLPRVMDVARCRAAGSPAEGAGSPSSRASSAALRWGTAWSAPRGELAAIAASRCDAAAALRFIRVPVWKPLPDGGLMLSDLRYGRDGNGFADVALPPVPAACPRGVPPWTPPRADLLGTVVDAGPRAVHVTTSR